jgi:hypothetical protein
MWCKCGIEIPEKRSEMGYTKCVSCSTEEMYGCVDIVYHKTGNTIEVLDAESARRMKKLSQRSGFGSLKALKGSSGGSSMGSCKVAKVVTQEEWEKQGAMIMDLFEKEGYEATADLIQEKLEAHLITPLQANKTLDIIKHISGQLQPEKMVTIYWKPECPDPKPDVDPEILKAMKDWRK